MSVVASSTRWKLWLALLFVIVSALPDCAAKGNSKAAQVKRNSKPQGFLRIVNMPGVSQGDFAEETVGRGATSAAIGVFPPRGLHVTEYANHQLLLSRTNGEGPPGQRNNSVELKGALVFGSRAHPHIYSQLPPNIVPTYSGSMLATKVGSRPISFFTGMMKLPAARPGQGREPYPNPVLYANDGTLADFLNLDRPELTAVSKPMIESIRKDRLLSAVLKIKPDFDAEAFEALLSETTIPMGSRAFIFLGNDNKMHCLLETDQRVDSLAPWLRAFLSLPIDGQALAAPVGSSPFDPGTNTVAYIGPRGMLDQSGALLANGDWGFNPIWTNNATGEMTLFNIPVWDMVTFVSSGANDGLLGELQLRSFINAGCDLTLDSRPTDCPCTCTKPDWEPDVDKGYTPSEIDLVSRIRSNCGNTGPD